jgi:hypothetical protein
MNIFDSIANRNNWLNVERFKVKLTQLHNENLFYRIHLNDEQLIIEFYPIKIFLPTKIKKILSKKDKSSQYLTV